MLHGTNLWASLVRNGTTLSFALLITGNQPSSAQVFVPPGLEPGDTYHLVFVTGSVAYSFGEPTGDITVYNDFVQAEAARHPTLTGTDLGVTYRAIASTSSVDARDNALVTAPVYRLDGELVASGFDDIWDGSIQAPISLREGRTFCSFDNDPANRCESDYVWTGSGPDGTDFGVFGLGAANALGDSSRSDGRWLMVDVFPSFSFDWSPLSAGFYALSEPLTVPVPPPLQPGDADMDYDLDQLDYVQVLQAGKYLTGLPATWGEGDWNGAPGGFPRNPPPGDGVFDQRDIIASLDGIYLTGPYAAIRPGGVVGDEQTSIVYDARTGEVRVDAPKALLSINIDSDAGIFTNEPAQDLWGSFDNDTDNNIFFVSFRDPSPNQLFFGNVAQPGLSEDFIANDLTVTGSYDSIGGPLGDVDLIYIPEPSSLALAWVAAIGFGVLVGRQPQHLA